ncbi:Crp/Fnr family transcriptional regulator [Proteinivorax hydrogeniformans]|uniref:Crp/Fnr family transcriptional regulator n=1 Tax=Proteinivorax hydrogeniformans TaxID=1826727 RepID=A0AAU8HV99_9FIRM
MKKNINLLEKNELFKGFNSTDLESILDYLSAKVVTYKKKDVILLQGSPVQFVGIVLSGTIQVIKEDIEGNINILAHFGSNDIFAETFACAYITESPVTVEAKEDCEIMFINFKKLIKDCQKTCIFHSSLVENMLCLIARKNILLNQKNEILSKRTTREKLLTYLNTQKIKSNSKKFSIPYSREGLANYLCVDRSALSRELCNMRDEGLIKFIKNEFEILF